MKKQQVSKPAVKPTVKPAAPKPFVPARFPGWIYAVIIAFCFVLYGNTLWNEFALDDTMVITQNEFVKSGVSGIPKIFKYDTFIGRYGEQVINLPGGRYRPLSVALLAVEYELFVDAETKQIIADKLDTTKTQYTLSRRYFSAEQLAAVDTAQTTLVCRKAAAKDNDDDAALYMHTLLPYASHFINMLLYALVACFLFKLLARLFPVPDTKGWKLLLNVPVIATLLFIAHPVHVEAVANIKGRDEIMTFLGALMALYYTLRWMDTRHWKYLVITFLCFLCGAFSKENAITFLVIIPMTIYFFMPYKLKPVLLFTALTAIPVFLLLKGAIGFALVLALIPLIILGMSPRGSAMRDIGTAVLPSFIAALIFTIVRYAVINMSPLPETELMNNPFLGMRGHEKWASIIFVLGRYLWLLFYPHPLTTDYYPYHIPKMDFGDIEVWLSFFIYAAMGVLVFLSCCSGKWRKNKYAYAVIWYVVPLSIVANLFVMIGTFMNERFVYISSVGFCFALAYFIITYLPKWLKNEKLYRQLVTVFLVAVLSLYSIQTIARNKAWFDDFTLSTTDVTLSPNSAKANYDAARVYSNRFYTSSDSTKRDFYVRQIYKYSKRAITIHPVYENALLLFSMTNSMLGTPPDSAAKYPVEASVQAIRQLLRRSPTHPSAADNLMMVLSRVPDPAQRAAILETVVPIAPNNFTLNYTLGSIYGSELSLDANRFLIVENLQKALPYLEKAVALNPKHAAALINLGYVYINTNSPVKAVKALEQAAVLTPNDPIVWRNLNYVYNVLGDAYHAEQARLKFVAIEEQRNNNGQ